MDTYYGTYARFDTASKKDASTLLGADNLVGDTFDIVFVTEDKQSIAWIQNKFGAKIGFFDKDVTRQLSILNARGWTLQAVLSFVAYTDSPEPGHYWGEMALICYDPAYAQEFSSFITTVAHLMSDGIRPDLELSESGIAQVIESKGSWSPSKRTPMPEKKTGTVIMKSRRKMSEKMIEQGRKGNKGCYFASWAFLLIAVAALLFALKSCGVF